MYICIYIYISIRHLYCRRQLARGAWRPALAEHLDRVEGRRVGDHGLARLRSKWRVNPSPTLYDSVCWVSAPGSRAYPEPPGLI